jgi:hypothetical protein
MSTQQIYVEVLDEGTIVFRPVSAVHIRDMIFKIEGDVPEGETWAFLPGEFVECGYRELMRSAELESTLVAFRSVPSEEKGQL